MTDPLTKQLPGGRLWTRSRINPQWWDSECGSFRIMPTSDRRLYLLLSFVHDSPDGEVWTRRFGTLERAMEQAESM